VTHARGFADQRLRRLKDPLDPSNRRISIIVQYLGKDGEAEESSEADAKNSSGKIPLTGIAKIKAETTDKK
jgi:chemotaxis protein MotB